MHFSSTPQVVPCRQTAFYAWRPAGGHLHRSHQSQRRFAFACWALASQKSDLSAVVIGSGFAGLSAAARLTRDFAQVVIISMRSWLGRIQLSAVVSTEINGVCKYCLMVLLHTLLYRENFADSVTEEESDDPELWRQHYEVLLP